MCAETVTPNYKWIKPDIGGDASNWGNVLNTTFDAIDAAVFNNQGLFANYLPLAGGALTGDLSIGGAFSVTGTATFGAVNVASVTASGAVNAASVTAASVTASGAVQGAMVNSTGDITASGNVIGNNAVNAGAGGFSTNGPLYAGGGVNAGNATIQTGGNASVGGTLTAGAVTANLATRFFASYYSDFGTNANTANNSRTLQFATGWTISAIVNSSAYYFQIGGNNVMTLDYASNLVLYQGGQAYKSGGGAWAATSDERVKRDIEPYRSGLEEVCRLDPVSFAYNGKGGTNDDGKRYVGLIAQMARRAMPSLVHDLPGEFEGKLDGQLGTDTSELIFTLINAVKELSARVAELEAR